MLNMNKDVEKMLNEYNEIELNEKTYVVYDITSRNSGSGRYDGEDGCSKCCSDLCCAYCLCG